MTNRSSAGATPIQYCPFGHCQTKALRFGFSIKNSLEHHGKDASPAQFDSVIFQVRTSCELRTKKNKKELEEWIEKRKRRRRGGAAGGNGRRSQMHVLSAGITMFSRMAFLFVQVFLVKWIKGQKKERLLELKGLTSTITAGMFDSTIKILSCEI